MGAGERTTGSPTYDPGPSSGTTGTKRMCLDPLLRTPGPDPGLLESLRHPSCFLVERFWWSPPFWGPFRESGDSVRAETTARSNSEPGTRTSTATVSGRLMRCRRQGVDTEFHTHRAPGAKKGGVYCDV